MERKVMGIDNSTKFTVLRRPNGLWLDEHNFDWIGNLPGIYNPVISHLPSKPEFVVLRGEYSKTEVEGALGASDFEHSIIEGPNNSELPFAIPSI